MLTVSLCIRGVFVAVGIAGAAGTAAVFYALWKATLLPTDVLRGLRGIWRLQTLTQPPIPHILLFLGVLAGVLPFSTNVNVTLLNLLRIIGYVGTSFLMLVCLRHFSPRPGRARLVVHAILLGDLIDALYGLYQVHTTGRLHVNGFNPQYVYFGLQVAQAVVLAMALLLAARDPLRRVVYAGVACICGAALVCSQARGPWIGLAVGVPVVIALSRQSIGLDRRWAGICLGVTATLTLAMAPLFVGHLLTILDPSWASNRERILIWGSTLRMIRDHPMTGVGGGQFAAIYNARYISPASVERWHPHAHNSFLQVLSEDGLPGLAASLSLLYGVSLFLRRVLRESPSSPYVIGTVGVFCALVVSSLVDCFLFLGRVQSEWVFWLLLGLVYDDRPTPSSCPAPDRALTATAGLERTPA